MRRWLSIFLLVLLPLQFSWAMAASSCQHETSKLSPPHFGHHEHKHETAKVKASENDGGRAASNLAALDDDCAVCHLGCVPPIALSHVVNFAHLIQASELSLFPERASNISEVPRPPDPSLVV